MQNRISIVSQADQEVSYGVIVRIGREEILKLLHNNFVFTCMYSGVSFRLAALKALYMYLHKLSIELTLYNL